MSPLYCCFLRWLLSQPDRLNNWQLSHRTEWWQPPPQQGPSRFPEPEASGTMTSFVFLADSSFVSWLSLNEENLKTLCVCLALYRKEQ